MHFVKFYTYWDNLSCPDFSSFLIEVTLWSSVALAGMAALSCFIEHISITVHTTAVMSIATRSSNDGK